MVLKGSLLNLLPRSCACRNLRYVTGGGGSGGGDLSFHHTTSPQPYRYLKLGDLVDMAAEKDPDGIFVSSLFQGIRKNFASFKQEVDSLAAGFLSLGLRPRDRVAIFAPNSYQWVLAQYASAKVGLILSCLNPSLKKDEASYLLNLTECKALIADAKHPTQDYYELLCEMEPDLATSQPGTLRSTRLKGLQHVILNSSESHPGTWQFNDIANNAGSEDFATAEKIQKRLSPDDPIHLAFTSGTTGMPKAAGLSHFYLINTAVFVGGGAGFLQEKQVACCQVPLFHLFGLMLGSVCNLLHLGKIVLPSPRFDSHRSLKAIQDEKCTILYGTPTMLIDNIEKYKGSPNYDISSLKSGACGGAPVPSQLVQDWSNVFKMSIHSLKCFYGTTEVGVVAGTGKESFFNGCYPIMPVLDHYQVKVVDDKGQAVPRGEKGEIWVRGNIVFDGYWGQKEQTEKMKSPCGWCRTGDLGVMDEEGRVAVIGRLKDIIIRGGENISPTEIESFLLTHPAVVEASVVGVPDDRMGEECCAWVKLSPGHSISADDFKAYFRGKIASYKIPKYVQFVDQFPVTASGKIQKFKLREKALELLNAKNDQFTISMKS